MRGTHKPHDSAIHGGQPCHLDAKNNDSASNLFLACSQLNVMTWLLLSFTVEPSWGGGSLLLETPRSPWSTQLSWPWPWIELVRPFWPF